MGLFDKFKKKDDPAAKGAKPDAAKPDADQPEATKVKTPEPKPAEPTAGSSNTGQPKAGGIFGATEARSEENDATTPDRHPRFVQEGRSARRR